MTNTTYTPATIRAFSVLTTGDLQQHDFVGTRADFWLVDGGNSPERAFAYELEARSDAYGRMGA